MAINFPSSPTNNQLHTEGGITWKYNSTKTVWETTVSGTVVAHVHAQSEITNLVADLALKVPTSRTVTGTGALNGGGDLSANRTLNVANDGVTNAMLANVATATFKGRTTAATGDPEDLTVTQATALLNAFTSALKGLVPASGGGTLNFLRADGAFAAPAGVDVPPGVMVGYGGTSAPTGWLLCDGAAVSRTTYAALFAAIDVIHGAGNGSTTFNVPDRRGRVSVGAGTGTISEAIAAANWATSDIITTAFNSQALKPRWQTGMKVQVTTTGVLPTGIAAATDYYVRRLSATTVSLYTSLALAMDRQSTSGRVNITATGSGTHTMACILAVRAVGEAFGHELSADTPLHNHDLNVEIMTAGAASASGIPSSTRTSTALIAAAQGDVEGITNMSPSLVETMIIKT